MFIIEKSKNLAGLPGVNGASTTENPNRNRRESTGGA